MLSGIVLRTVAMARRAPAGLCRAWVVRQGAGDRRHRHVRRAAGRELAREPRAPPSRTCASSAPRSASSWRRPSSASGTRSRRWHAADRDALLWQVATYQAVLRDLQIHGFALILILGVSIARPAALLGVPEIDGRAGPGAPGGCSCCGVLGETALFLMYRFTGRHVLAAALLVPWGMLAGGALSVAAVFRPWRPFPVPDRSAKFVRVAYLWLAILVRAAVAAAGLPGRRSPPVQPRLLRFDPPRDHGRVRVADDHGCRCLRRAHAPAAAIAPALPAWAARSC